MLALLVENSTRGRELPRLLKQLGLRRAWASLRKEHPGRSHVLRDWYDLAFLPGVTYRMLLSFSETSVGLLL